MKTGPDRITDEMSSTESFEFWQEVKRAKERQQQKAMEDAQKQNKEHTVSIPAK